MGARKEINEEHLTVVPSKRVSSKTPKTSGEMTAAEKKSRVAQKKRLGQPAGKPKRVTPLKRKKK